MAPTGATSRWALLPVALSIVIILSGGSPGGGGLAEAAKQQQPNATTVSPATATTLLAQKNSRPGLITRTTDAIYRVLSGVFSYDYQDDEDLQQAEQLPAAVENSSAEFGLRNRPDGASPPAPTTPLPVPRAVTTTSRPVGRTTSRATRSFKSTSSTSTSTSASTSISSPSSAPESRVAGQPHLELDLYLDEPYAASIPPPVRLRTTTTITTTRPRPQTSSSSTSTTTSPMRDERPTTERPVDGLLITDEEILPVPSKVELGRIIDSALSSLYSLSPYLNRSTRLAPSHEQPPEVSAVETTGKLTLDGQLATREDVHLLCKLLHKQLEAANSTSGATNKTSPLRTTGLGPTEAPPSVRPQPEAKTTSAPVVPRGQLVDSPSELNEAHEDRLLESTFALEPSADRDQTVSRPVQPLNQSHEEAARNLLLDLYNVGARSRRKFSDGASGEPAGSEYEATGEELSASTEGNEGPQLVSLRLWSKSVQGRGGGRIRLVYWLLEPVQVVVSSLPSSPNAGRASRTRLRLLGAREAGDLIDRLDHSAIRRRMEAAGLRPLVLVAAHKRQAEADLGSLASQPNVIDDTLAEPSQRPANQTGPGQEAQGQEGGAKRSGLQLLLDRLTSGSFGENLQLYLILFIMILFLVILCCAVPMICFKSGRDSSRPSRRRSLLVSTSREPLQPVPSISGAFKGLGETSTSVGAEQRRREEQLKQANEAIWRKLSNSTTTLTRDQSRVLRKDGTVPVQVVRGEAEGTRAGETGGGERRPFEWYSFEDRLEHEERLDGPAGQQQTLLLSDRRHLTKSVQTHDQGPSAGPDRLLMSFRNQLEARSSNTLTKSELVMLKEKLVPIGLHQQQVVVAGPEVVGLPSELHDYVNTGSVRVELDSGEVGSAGAAATGGSRGAAEETRRRKRRQRQRREGPGEEEEEEEAAAGPSFIDSSCSRSSRDSVQGLAREPLPTGARPEPTRELEEEERRPKMRCLELPAKARQKVEAIRSELGRLERRDKCHLSTGTYQRYDFT